jgi:hypothetical protein
MAAPWPSNGHRRMAPLVLPCGRLSHAADQCRGRLDCDVPRPREVPQYVCFPGRRLCQAWRSHLSLAGTGSPFFATGS